MAQVTILVYAWDTYRVAWDVFCYGLNKYWSDCPYPLLFLTNHLDAPCGTTVKVGDVNDFVTKMTLGLEQVTTPYILFMHDDYWLKTPVSTRAIADFVDILERDQADYIRLRPKPKPDRPYPEDRRLGIINEDAAYRVSFMASLWRVSVLRDLLKPGESIWEMEKSGSKRSAKYGDRFLCVNYRLQGVNCVSSAITSRQWTRAAYQYALDENIKIDFAALPLPPRRQLIGTNLRVFASRAKRKINRLFRDRLTR